MLVDVFRVLMALAMACGKVVPTFTEIISAFILHKLKTT